MPKLFTKIDGTINNNTVNINTTIINSTFESGCFINNIGFFQLYPPNSIIEELTYNNIGFRDKYNYQEFVVDLE